MDNASNTANAVALTVAERQGELKKYITSAGVMAAIKAIAAKHVTPERIARIACVALSRVPNLAACEPLSIVRALMDAAQLGLEPNTPLRFASIVPYMNNKTKRYEAQLIVEYGGLIQLSHQSGVVDDIYAEVVRARDALRVTYGTEKAISHEPNLTAGTGDDNPVIGAYAVAVMKSGRPKFTYLSKVDVDAHRDRSPAGKSGPWVTDYAEMAKKTAIRMLCKTLPRSAEKPDERFAKAASRSDVIDVDAIDTSVDLSIDEVDIPKYDESSTTNTSNTSKLKELVKSQLEVGV